VYYKICENCGAVAPAENSRCPDCQRVLSNQSLSEGQLKQRLEPLYKEINKRKRTAALIGACAFGFVYTAAWVLSLWVNGFNQVFLKLASLLFAAAEFYIIFSPDNFVSPKKETIANYFISEFRRDKRDLFVSVLPLWVWHFAFIIFSVAGVILSAFI